MSITPYLDDLEVDPETKRVLSAALEMTRASLGLADDFANGIIAKRISESCARNHQIRLRAVKQSEEVS
jgi:hypothetical protein